MLLVLTFSFMFIVGITPPGGAGTKRSTRKQYINYDPTNREVASRYRRSLTPNPQMEAGRSEHVHRIQRRAITPGPEQSWGYYDSDDEQHPKQQPVHFRQPSYIIAMDQTDMKHSNQSNQYGNHSNQHGNHNNQHGNNNNQHGNNNSQHSNHSNQHGNHSNQQDNEHGNHSNHSNSYPSKLSGQSAHSVALGEQRLMPHQQYPETNQSCSHSNGFPCPDSNSSNTSLSSQSQHNSGYEDWTLSNNQPYRRPRPTPASPTKGRDDAKFIFPASPKHKPTALAKVSEIQRIDSFKGKAKGARFGADVIRYQYVSDVLPNHQTTCQDDQPPTDNLDRPMESKDVQCRQYGSMADLNGQESVRQGTPDRSMSVPEPTNDSQQSSMKRTKSLEDVTQATISDTVPAHHTHVSRTRTQSCRPYDYAHERPVVAQHKVNQAAQDKPQLSPRSQPHYQYGMPQQPAPQPGQETHCPAWQDIPQPGPVQQHLLPSGAMQQDRLPSGAKRQDMPPPSSIRQDMPPPKSIRQDMPPPSSVRQDMPPPGSMRHDMPPTSSIRHDMAPAGSIRQDMPPPGRMRQDISPPGRIRQDIPHPGCIRQDMPPPDRVPPVHSADVVDGNPQTAKQTAFRSISNEWRTSVDEGQYGTYISRKAVESILSAQKSRPGAAGATQPSRAPSDGSMQAVQEAHKHRHNQAYQEALKVDIPGDNLSLSSQKDSGYRSNSSAGDRNSASSTGSTPVDSPAMHHHHPDTYRHMSRHAPDTSRHHAPDMSRHAPDIYRHHGPDTSRQSIMTDRRTSSESSLSSGHSQQSSSTITPGPAQSQPRSSTITPGPAQSQPRSSTITSGPAQSQPRSSTITSGPAQSQPRWSTPNQASHKPPLPTKQGVRQLIGEYSIFSLFLQCFLMFRI